MLSPEISQGLASISKGAEEYQQLKMMKKPVQISNYIALSIVALLVIFCSIWFGLYIAKSITIPIMKFAEGTQRVSQGDLSYKINFKADDEIGILVDSFNSMTKELATGKEKLAISKKMMLKQNAAIKESRQYMEIVLKNISAGVISIDKSGIVTTINKAAETMLNISSKDILSKNYNEILKDEYLKAAKEVEKKLPFSLKSVEFPINIIINGTPRHFAAYFNALKEDI